MQKNKLFRAVANVTKQSKQPGQKKETKINNVQKQNHIFKKFHVSDIFITEHYFEKGNRLIEVA